MSNLDKTGAQLIHSIRKTKAAPATAATTASKEKQTKPTAVGKASKSAVTSQQPTVVNHAIASQTVQPPAATPYPDGSTVWPD
jgi:hypothetical protein